MPLVHSKKPAAFKENVRKEVEAGKPVKQAVAIAYDVKRRCVHGGPAYCSQGCYSEGGTVDKLHQGAHEARRYSAQRQETGINRPRLPYPHNKGSFGESEAGYSAKDNTPILNAQAKDQHKNTLLEMRSDKTDRRNLSEGGPVEAEGNGGTSLAEVCADELHAALEKKDRKAIVSAIHSIMNLKEEE